MKGIKPCLAVGGLVVEYMWFKMAFCPWVHPLHPQSFTWAFGAGGPAARSGSGEVDGGFPAPTRADPPPRETCCPAKPKQGQINGENMSDVKHATNKHCLFCASPPSCLIV